MFGHRSSIPENKQDLDKKELTLRNATCFENLPYIRQAY